MGAITHAKVSLVPDSGDTDDVQMSDWNDPHAQNLTAADVGAEASGAVATHSADTTSVHGISDTSALETTTGSAGKITTHEAASNPHPTYETSAEAQAKVDAHEADTTSIHGITNTASLETTTGSQSKVDTHAGLTDSHGGFVSQAKWG